MPYKKTTIKAKLFAKILFKWSLAITIPLVFYFTYWGLATVNMYWDFGMRYGTFGNHAKLAKIGRMNFEYPLYKLKPYFSHPSAKRKHKIPQINLFLDESSEELLNSNLPHSGRQYVKGRLLYPDSKIRKVKIKYRGDFFWHWWGPKKSLRIKTKKRRLYKGIRQINLITPKFTGLIHDPLTYYLARQLDIISPRGEMINLSINGKNRGVYYQVEQIEEMVLRMNKRMPGDLYKGELVARDKYTGLSATLFQAPKLWEKAASNNHFPESSYAPLVKLCSLINGKIDEKSMEELRGTVDIKSFGNFAALILFIQSYHYDNAHNWRLYYDPWRNVFEPVVWDPVGWNPLWIPWGTKKAALDIIPSDLDQILSMDYQFLLARHQAIENFFLSGDKNQFINFFDTTSKKVDPSILQDPRMSFVFSMFNPKRVIRSKQKFKKDIIKILDDIYAGYITSNGKVFFSQVKNSPPEETRLQLSIDGRRPIQSLTMLFSHPVKEVSSASVTYWKGEKRYDHDITGSVTVQGTKVTLDIDLLARFEPLIKKEESYLMRRALKVEPAYYEISIAGSNSENQLLDVLAQRGSSEQQQIEQTNFIEKIPFNQGYAIVVDNPLLSPEIWQGVVNISGVQRINNNLIIQPGTTIQMKKDASLIIMGRLIAKGTKSAPIRIISEDGSPWGTFALRGEKAKGSVLSYCEFSNGSGLKSSLEEYTAMLSVHNVKGVKIENCKFSDNHIVDDMVHIVYSNVEFTNCLFERSFSDALDVDISQAVVNKCNFSASGNDALDLMTSKVIVVDSRLTGNKDKGISVGEGTTLLAINNQILRNEIGVQVKDNSLGILYNTDFVKNKAAIDAYKKNWRYDGGGTLRIDKSYFSGNKSNFTTDKKSLITVYDSYIDQNFQASKRIFIDHTVNSTNKRKVRTTKTAIELPDQIKTDPFFAPYRGRINYSHRGSSQKLN